MKIALSLSLVLYDSWTENNIVLNVMDFVNEMNLHMLLTTVVLF